MGDNKRDIPFSVWRKIAMATWLPRTDPTILATVDIDAETLLAYIDQVRAATGVHVTPVHLVGRAQAKVFEAMPGLNGRVLFGGFLPSATIDGFFVVSLRTDMGDAAQASGTDLSGTVVRRVNEKPPWVIARELTERSALIRSNQDPQFAMLKSVARLLPPYAIRALMGSIGFITESMQLPIPGVEEARPFGSFLISNVGTFGLDSGFAPVPTFCHVPVTTLVGTVVDKPVARDGQVVVRPMLPVGVMIDHRFVDGYQAATMATIFRSYLADPGASDPVPATPARRARRPSNGRGRSGHVQHTVPAS